MQRPQRSTKLITLALVLGVALWLVGAGPAAAQNADIELEWGAQDCDFVIVLLPTGKDTIQPYLPEGFTPTIPENQPLPPDPRMEAVLGYEVFHCGQQTVGEHVAQDGIYAAVWTFVEPPEGVADPDHPLTFFKFATLVPDDDQRATLADLDVSVSDGSGDMADMAVTSAGALFDVSFTLEPDGGSYHASGSGSSPADFGGSFVEYSPLDGRDGFAAWRTDFAADDAFSGAGVARWDDDAFAAEVLGTTETEGWMLTGQGLRFTDATITVPRTDIDNEPAPHAERSDPGSAGRDGQQERDALPSTGGGAAAFGAFALLTGWLSRSRRDR